MFPLRPVNLAYKGIPTRQKRKREREKAAEGSFMRIFAAWTHAAAYPRVNHVLRSNYRFPGRTTLVSDYSGKPSSQTNPAHPVVEPYIAQVLHSLPCRVS